MRRGTVDGFDGLYETARALGEGTRFRIYRELWRSTRPLSVREIADTFSLHPNAVRQHLSRLEEAGLVSSRPGHSGGAGRPRRLYRPTPEPVDLTHPSGSARALVAMLSEAVEHLPADRRSLVEFGRSWGRRWAARRRRGNGRIPRSPRGRLQLLAGELAEWGWRPSEGTNGQPALITERCLFHDRGAGDNGRCCALEEGLLRGLAEMVLNDRAARATVRGCRLEVTL